MVTSSPLNRRRWLQLSGSAMLGLALASKTRLRAQHEVSRSSRSTEIARVNGNENPYGPSQMAVMAMMENLEQTFRYATRPEVERLTELIVAKEGVKPEQIVLGVGSGEILQTVGLWLGAKGGEIVTVTPGYTQMTRTAERAGAKIVNVPLTKELVHDLDAMAAKVTDRTTCVYLCNPNNPTGTVVDPAKLKPFVEEMSKRCLVFVDEAYLECSDNFEANTMAPVVATGANVIVARTFSKIYGLAGQRIGYGLLPESMVETVRSFSTGSLNKLAVTAAIASLEDVAYVDDTRQKIKEQRDALCAVLDSLGRKYAQPQGNFVFFQTGMPIKMFQERMLAERVMVGREFPPMLDWCRISIGSPEEMAQVHAALRKVLAA